MAHGSARTTLRVRKELVQMRASGVSVCELAQRFGVSRTTVYRWVGRAGAGCELVDRSSRPHVCPRQTPEAVAQRIVAARWATGYGPARLGGELGMSASTCWKVLRRAGCSRLPRSPKEPVVRYERERPGELLHIDTKRLGRFSRPGHRVHGDPSTQVKSERVGFDYVHVAIDDRTRLSYVEISDEQTGRACATFLERACDWFAANGIRIERVMTDNAKAYTSNAWKDVCAHRSIARRYTRHYRPQTNGKAERFIRTMLNEWAYADSYNTSHDRAKALPRWCDNYNTRRYHTSIKTTPWQRAANDLNAVTNLCRHYS